MAHVLTLLVLNLLALLVQKYKYWRSSTSTRAYGMTHVLTLLVLSLLALLVQKKYKY